MPANEVHNRKCNPQAPSIPLTKINGRMVQLDPNAPAVYAAPAPTPEQTRFQADRDLTLKLNRWAKKGASPLRYSDAEIALIMGQHPYIELKLSPLALQCVVVALQRHQDSKTAADLDDDLGDCGFGD